MAPLERFFKLPHARRGKLLQVARKEFVAHGFERASYNRIIAGADVSKGAMYYYFADKADLFASVLEAELTKLTAQMGPLREVGDADEFWRALSQWGQRLVATTVERPELLLLARCLYSNAGVQHSVVALRGQVHGWVSGLLERGQVLGAVREDIPIDLLATGLTHLLLGMDAWFAEHAATLSPEEFESLAAKLLMLCRDLVGAKAGA